MEKVEWIRKEEEKIDFICTFDAEGWEFKVISDDYRTYIINEEEYPSRLIHIEDLKIQVTPKQEEPAF